MLLARCPHAVLAVIIIGVGLTLTISARAAQGLELKGDFPGGSLYDFCVKYDRLADKSDGIRAPHLVFGGIFVDGSRDGMPDLRSRLAILVSKVFPFEVETVRRETIAGVTAEFSYYFVANSLDDWDQLAGKKSDYQYSLGWKKWNDRQILAAQQTKLQTIWVTFPEENFNKVADALTKKYGAPKSTEKNTYTNRLGAVFDGVEYRWDQGDIVLSAIQRSGKIDQSRLMMTDLRLLEKHKANKEVITAEAVKDL